MTKCRRCCPQELMNINCHFSLRNIPEFLYQVAERFSLRSKIYSYLSFIEKWVQTQHSYGWWKVACVVCLVVIWWQNEVTRWQKVLTRWQNFRKKNCHHGLGDNFLSAPLTKIVSDWWQKWRHLLLKRWILQKNVSGGDKKVTFFGVTFYLRNDLNSIQKKVGWRKYPWSFISNAPTTYPV